jgi:hypothetical protein
MLRVIFKNAYPELVVDGESKDDLRTGDDIYQIETSNRVYTMHISDIQMIIFEKEKEG